MRFERSVVCDTLSNTISWGLFGVGAWTSEDPVQVPGLNT